MWLRLTIGGQVVELADDLDVGGIEADLLVGLAQRRLDLRLAGIDSAAGEADLTGVVAQRRRSASQQHAGVAVGVVGEQHEHRRRAHPGEVGVDAVDVDPVARRARRRPS